MKIVIIIVLKWVVPVVSIWPRITPAIKPGTTNKWNDSIVIRNHSSVIHLLA